MPEVTVSPIAEYTGAGEVLLGSEPVAMTVPHCNQRDSHWRFQCSPVVRSVTDCASGPGCDEPSGW